LGRKAAVEAGGGVDTKYDDMMYDDHGAGMSDWGEGCNERGWGR
jgi:NAD/NADP transhydrogenase alpha subunit